MKIFFNKFLIAIIGFIYPTISLASDFKDKADKLAEQATPYLAMLGYSVLALAIFLVAAFALFLILVMLKK